MSKTTDAWLPLWIGDYMADTAHLSRDEHGGYLLLLFAYWRSGGPLPDDDKRLANIVKATPSEWKKLRPVLAEFFLVDDGVWTSKRMERELADAAHRSSKASGRAKTAAEARWKKTDQGGAGDSKSDASSMPEACLKHAPSIAQALHEECPSPSPSPISIPDGIENNRAAAKKAACPEDVSPALWEEWRAHRKAKRSAVSQGVVDSFRREAEKLGWTLADAFRKSIDRGWVGFEAEWVRGEVSRGGAPPARGGPAARFDPVAYVNQGQKNDPARHEKIIHPERVA